MKALQRPPVVAVNLRSPGAADCFNATNGMV